MRLNITSLSLAVTCLSPLAHADVLATWDFDGIAGQSSLAASSTDSSISSATLSSSAASVNTSATNSNVSTIGWGFGFNTNQQQSFNDALTAGHYFDINIASNPGELLNLDSIDLNLTSFGDTFFENVTVLASADNFNNTVAVGTSTPGAASTPFFGGELILDQLIGNGLFAGNNDEIAFRVVGFGSQNQGQTELFLCDTATANGLTIHGSTSPLSLTPVPEISSTLPLGTLFACALFGRRRKSRA